MSASEKSVICRKRTGVGACKYKMIGISNNFCFCPCICTPQQEYHRFFTLIQKLYYIVCKLFPAHTLMTVSAAFTYSQYIIKQKNAVFSPFSKLSVFSGIVDTDIFFISLKILTSDGGGATPFLLKSKDREPVRRHDKGPDR